MYSTKYLRLLQFVAYDTIWKCI